MNWKQHQETFRGKKGFYSFTGPASLLLAVLDYGKAVQEWADAANAAMDNISEPYKDDQ